MKRKIWRDLRSIVIISILVMLISGCVTSTFQTSSTLKRREAKECVLLMPLDVELSTLTFGGVLQPEAEWTANAKSHIKEAFRLEMNQLNIQPLCTVDVNTVNLNQEEEEKRVQLIKLHETVGHTILQHQYLPDFKLPAKNGAFDWSLGPEAKFIKEKYGAGYALFIFVRDSYASGGRVAANIIGAAFGIGVPLGRQVGFASLVDLETGEVVWFNRLARGTGDLRTQGAAAETIHFLLSDFPQ